VDLKGYTTDARPGIFACRAAPVQVSYLGYPGTVGADYIDYLIADRVLVPEGMEHHYQEKLVFLPGSYQVNDAKREIAGTLYSRTEAGLPETGVVFCSFNNSYKITPAMFDVWMRILDRTPESCLWLLADNDTARANLLREAAARGIDPGRLVFAPRLPLPEHLARMRLADLFLDTFPCNAHTTASDALWAGVPLLTLAGEAFAARVAASLLTAVGLPELVAGSPDVYEDMAVALAAQPERLVALREALAANRARATLFDTHHHVRKLEAAFLTLHERSAGGLPPETVEVEDPGALLSGITAG